MEHSLNDVTSRLTAILRSFMNAANKTCNHCLVLKEVDAMSASYRTLMVVIYAEGEGIPSLEIAQQALLRPAALKAVLERLSLGGVIHYKLGRWHASGCTCNLPF